MKRKILILLSFLLAFDSLVANDDMSHGDKSDVETFQHGYKGFIGLNALYPLSSHGLAIGGWTTTHGYQIDPRFFVGGGITWGAVMYWPWDDVYSYSYEQQYSHSRINAAVYAAAVYRYSQAKRSFVADIKIGKWLASGDGVYASLSPGIRWRIKNGKMGLTLSLVYNVSGLASTYDKVTEGVQLDSRKNEIQHSLGLGFSFDF